MRYEQQTAPVSEYFEHARSTDDVLSSYNDLTTQAIVDYHARLARTAQRYEEAFVQELRTPGAHNINAVLENTQTHVRWAIDTVHAEVKSIMGAVSIALPDTLASNSRMRLEQIKADAVRFGVESALVIARLDRTADEEWPVFKAALDIEVLQNAQSYVTVPGSPELVVMALNRASSESACAAMLTALDSTSLGIVYTQVAEYGLQSPFVSAALRWASSHESAAAMRLALDVDVLAYAQEEVNTYGIDVPYILKHASSQAVREVLQRHIDMPAKHHKDKNHNPFCGGIREEDFLRAFGAASVRNYRETSRLSMNSHSEIDRMVKRIIEEAVSRNRYLVWLQSEDPQDVRRLIYAINSLREKARAEGNTITDRQIYRMYRTAADKGHNSATNTDLADPQAVTSFKILDALMGGDLHGKLPF